MALSELRPGAAQLCVLAGVGAPRAVRLLRVHSCRQAEHSASRFQEQRKLAECEDGDLLCSAKFPLGNNYGSARMKVWALQVDLGCWELCPIRSVFNRRD